MVDQPTRQEIKNPETKYEEVLCGECERPTRHKVLTEVCEHWSDEVVELSKWFQVIQCQGCMTVSFCEASQFSEDWDVGDDDVPFIPIERMLFPKRLAGRPVLREAHLLPDDVYQVYEEAHAALCAELPIMAGLGVRTLVEAVCRDREMKGRTLEQRIAALQEAGLVTSSGADILHHLRQMGNRAAHEMKAHTLEEISAAFGVVEYLLQGVYILPRQAERLPNATAGE